MFYDLFLKKTKFVFDKKKLFLIIYIQNEIKQFRWGVTSLFTQLFDYGLSKGLSN